MCILQMQVGSVTDSFRREPPTLQPSSPMPIIGDRSAPPVNIPEGKITHPLLTMGRARVRDRIPDQRRAIAQQPPILLSPVYPYDVSFDPTFSRAVVCASLYQRRCVSTNRGAKRTILWTYRIMIISVPRFTVRLIPIYHPIPSDMRGSPLVCAPIRTPNGDTPDLNGHVHTCVSLAPAFRDITEHPPILPLSIRTTFPRRPNDLPECAMGNASFLRLFPQLFLMFHRLPLVFRVPPLHREGGIRHRDAAGGRFDVYERFQRVEAGEHQKGLEQHDRDANDQPTADTALRLPPGRSGNRRGIWYERSGRGGIVPERSWRRGIVPGRSWRRVGFARWRGMEARRPRRVGRTRQGRDIAR